MKKLPIEEFTDEILIRIFEFVIGRPKYDNYTYFYTFFDFDDVELHPTVIEDFHMLLILPAVCKRWNRLIKSSLHLWKNVYIGPALPNINRDTIFLQVPAMPWWATRAPNISQLHLNAYK